MVAALTHFSAMPCSSRSSVDVTTRPPRSTTGQVSASGHNRAVSSRRTCHTKCEAFQPGFACGASTTGSARAASKSAAVNVSPVSGVRSSSIRVSTRFRRTTIGASAGTTRRDSVHAASSAWTASRHSSTALATRS